MSGALAPPGRRGSGQSARGLQSVADETLNGLYHPRPAAAVLLAQVLARLPGVVVPVVQFIQASPGDFGAAVVRSFAEAALPRLGRTLLVTLPSMGVRSRQADTCSVPVAQVGRRRARKAVGGTLEIVADLCLSGLYHARIGCETEEQSSSPGQPSAWLSGAKLDFRLMVIDCGAIEDNPVAIELASRCHGSVLSVAAGDTSLSQVHVSAKHIRLAGGTMLGTVLYDAPTSLHPGGRPWFGRRQPKSGG